MVLRGPQAALTASTFTGSLAPAALDWTLPAARCPSSSHVAWTRRLSCWPGRDAHTSAGKGLAPSEAARKDGSFVCCVLRWLPGARRGRPGQTM